MILRELFESATNSVAIIFGRFNPPHFGHVAAWQVAAGFPEWYVGTNQSTQGPKDPLPYNIKIEAMKKLYPKLNGHLVPEQSWFTLATMVYKKHGEVTLYIVTDSTDVKIYLSMIQKQNGVEGPHGYYKFKSIEWAKAERQSEASLVRKAVKENNPKDFEKHSGVSANTVVAGHPYFDLVRHYMLPYMQAEEEKERAAAEKAKIKAEKEAAKKIKENRDLGSPFKRGSGNPLYGYDTDAMRQATGTMEEEDMLDERRMADLYHATNAEKLPAILKSGHLVPGRNAYVSLTRDKNYNYAKIESEETAVFVLDQPKLAYNRKIEPYDWHMSSDDDPEAWARDPELDRRSESEERVKGPISLKYVKEIQLPKTWAVKDRNHIKIIKAIQNMGIKISFTTSESVNESTLDEVADQPYRYMLTKKLPDARQYMFQTDSGTKFQVFFSLLDSGTEKIADVGFADQTDKDNPTIGVTGKGDAFRVFATVGAIVKEYVNSVKPDFLSFNGKTQDPGRIKLYDMIAKNITRYLKDYEQSSHTMPGASDEKGYMLQRITKPVDEVSKVSLSSDPDNFGAWVRDGGTPEKTVVIPTSKIHVFEPDSKFADPHHAKNLANIVKAIKAGKKLPPILVRRHGIDRFQVVDGHHRFMAYRMAGAKSIPARVVDPKNVKEV